MSDEQGESFGMIKLVVVVVLSVLLATGTSYFMFNKLVGADDIDKAGADVRELGPTCDIGQFLINLANGRRFIKLSIVLEVSNDKVIKELGKRKPQVRDNIISTLRKKDYKDITSSQGDRRLRTEIMNKINEHLLEGKVTNVFFTEFVVQ